MLTQHSRNVGLQTPLATMVTQAERDTSAFGYNGIASLAKAVAFRSLASEALKANERISATVCAYYSLLHLAITLIYLCPDKLSPPLRNKLRAERQQGGIDPSSSISHNAALVFVRACGQDGLDARLYSNLQHAKGLREFVNYGPRLQQQESVLWPSYCSAYGLRQADFCDQRSFSITAFCVRMKR